jgi:F-type H+-transporting ATPase subunit a
VGEDVSGIVLAAHKGYEAPSLQAFLFSPWISWEWFGVHFYVNKIMGMLFFGMLCIAVFYLVAFRRPQMVPGKLQFTAETIYNFIRNSIARDVIGPEGLRFAPYLTILFSFVLIMNLYEILPLAQVPVNSRIAFPAMLAGISWVLFNWVGIRRKGAGRYFRDIMFPPGVPWPVYILLTPIELVSTLIVRPFTLAVRLFANMFAGHVLLLVFFTATLYLLAVPNFSKVFVVVSFPMAVILTAFELLVIVLQAYIFTILTAVYVSGALAEEH